MRRHKYSAFTLIELIVVIGISVILLSIMIVPVIQGFNITRAAQGFAEVQSEGRRLIAQMETELSNAVSVRSNSGNAGLVNIPIFGETNNPIVYPLQGAKLDYYPPAEGDASNAVGGAFVNPDTGKIDPTSPAPIGDVNLPASRGLTMVRYWIGLRDPQQPYNNPYSQYRTPGGSRWAGNAGGGGRDNLFVLYRAEVQPQVLGGGGTLVPNTQFFDVDANGNVILDDPDFFIPTGGVDAAHDARTANWKRVGRIVSQFSRYDMVMPEFNKQNNQLLANAGNGRFVPLLRFQPARVSAETTAANVALSTGSETDNAAKVGPISYRTQYGDMFVRGAQIWPSRYPGSFGPLNNSAGRLRNAWSTGYLTITGDGLGLSRADNGMGIFNNDTYVAALKLQGQANPPYPFTSATLFDAWPLPGGDGTDDPYQAGDGFLPVWFDNRSGQVNASFSVREVGTDQNIPVQYRVPTSEAMAASGATIPVGVHVGDPTAYNAEPSPATIPWQNAMTDLTIGVNRRFNSLWANWTTLAPTLDRAQWCKRFIDLRVMRQPGNFPGPLDKRPWPTGTGWVRGQITPGSEEVIGPDQRPGPNYGKYVRYTRTTSRPVGPNQYYINYVDQPEPDWSTLGYAGANYDPSFYDGTSFLSAVLQAQYRAGYIEFNSQLGEPIPAITNNPADPADDEPGNFLISYNFQFTEPRDIVALDYDSSEMIEIVLTVRNYPQTSIPNPQYMTVKGSAQVRNFTR